MDSYRFSFNSPTMNRTTFDGKRKNRNQKMKNTYFKSDILKNDGRDKAMQIHGHEVVSVELL